MGFYPVNNHVIYAENLLNQNALVYASHIYCLYLCFYLFSYWYQHVYVFLLHILKSVHQPNYKTAYDLATPNI